MDKSLSIVIPVQNVETSLGTHVNLLLQELSDVATNFEVLIVDDASTDQTEEVAVELAHRYPQVQVTRHARSAGMAAAIETGLHHSRGEIVLIHNVQTHLSPNDLPQLWGIPYGQQLVLTQTNSATPGLSAATIERLIAWSGTCKKSTSQMRRVDNTQVVRRKPSIPNTGLAPTGSEAHQRVRADFAAQDSDKPGEPKILSRMRRLKTAE